VFEDGRIYNPQGELIKCKDLKNGYTNVCLLTDDKRKIFLLHMANHLAKNGADFNFKKFRELCNKKSKSIFMELLTGDVSVANL
jgi:hypothetical protein